MNKALPNLLSNLLDSLRCLPGIGPKTAQRMALYLLSKKKPEALKLSEALKNAVTYIVKCDNCRNFSESNKCSICLDESRDRSLLCIIENPHDLIAIEQLGQYNGLYFLLLGKISPIDGVFPEHLGIDILEQRFSEGGLKEVIIATNSTLEGEVTTQYLATLAEKYNIYSTRIAHGVPVGADIEQLDNLTLKYALSGRVSTKVDNQNI